MFYAVIVVDSAALDQDRIFDYYIQFGADLIVRIGDSLDKLYERISTMPTLYPVYLENPLYRKAVIIYDLVVYYEVDSSSKTVYIHHIVHSKMDIRRIIT